MLTIAHQFGVPSRETTYSVFKIIVCDYTINSHSQSHAKDLLEELTFMSIKFNQRFNL